MTFTLIPIFYLFNRKQKQLKQKSSYSTTVHWLENNIASNFNLCKMTDSNFEVDGRQISMYSTKKYEQQQNDKFNFLEVKFSIAKNKIETSDYIKPTDNGTSVLFRKFLVLITEIHA